MEGNKSLGLEGNIGNIDGLAEEIKRLNLTGPLTEHLQSMRETGRGFPSSNQASIDPGFKEYISGHPQEPEPQPEPVLRSSTWFPEPRPSQDVVEKLLEEAKKPFDISKVEFESNTPAHKEFKKKLERYNQQRAKIKKERSSTPKLTSRGINQGLGQLKDENERLGIDREITAIEHLLNLKMSLGKK